MAIHINCLNCLPDEFEVQYKFWFYTAETVEEKREIMSALQCISFLASRRGKCVVSFDEEKIDKGKALLENLRNLGFSPVLKKVSAKYRIEVEGERKDYLNDVLLAERFKEDWQKVWIGYLIYDPFQMRHTFLTRDTTFSIF